jgi:hypothetical protein
MLHSALFVAAVPDNKQVWQNFIDAVDGKAALRPQAIVRLAENIWLLLVRETPAPLGWELSPNLGDGLRDQAAAVWDCEDAGLAATSIPSVNLTP